MRERDAKQRLFGRVTMSDECWLFPTKRRAGYPTFWLNGRFVDAHRAAWELTYGAIPAGLRVCHTCDNPACVNPSHLFSGSAKDNTQDMLRKGRVATGARHGSRTHPEKWYRGSAATAKLTEVQAIEIRRRRRAGEELLPLAKEYGVSIGTVSNIGLGKSWTHLSSE